MDDVAPTGGPAAEDRRSGTVRQMRLVVEVEDLDGAVAFYRDALGLTEQAAFSGGGEARVVILDAGRATLELANGPQRRMIDEVEVGRVLEPATRVAFEVDDTRSTVEVLRAAGATSLGPPVETPWRSLNARLVAPPALPVTIFQELATLEDRAVQPGFGTAGGEQPTQVQAEEDGLEVHLDQAVALAVRNAEAGQLPFGALVIRDGVVVGSGVNTVRRDGDPTAHAEVVAIRDACRELGTQDLTGATVVASCEPCAMCHTVCATVGIHRIVYAAPKESVPDLGGIDRRPIRAMQAALRALRPHDVQHVQTTGADEPFIRFTG